MTWKDTLRKAPFKWQEGKTPSMARSPEDYRTRMAARSSDVGGTYDKPKLPKGVRSPSIPDYGDFDVAQPEVQDSLGDMSEKDQQLALKIVREYHQDIRQAYENYKKVVGEFKGQDTTKLISSYNSFLQRALALERAHRQKPWYKRLFGRGKRYRELVQKVNDNADEIQQAYNTYKNDVRQAGRKGQRRTELLESGIRMGEVHKRIAAKMAEIVNIADQLDEDVER